MNRYFNGSSDKELHISDITEYADEVPAREWVMVICDVFEDILENYDVTIPCGDRAGNKEEARLFGEPFDKTALAVSEILNKLVEKVKENPNSKYDFDRF